MPRSLRPGLAVVRRDDGHLQVGIDPPLRVVLADHPDVRRVLDALSRGEEPAAGPATSRVIQALAAAGALVDRGRAAPPAAPVATVEAAWAGHGDDAPRRLAARAAARVSWDAPAGVDDPLRTLLRDAGLGTASTGTGDVHLVVAHGEVARARVDACMRDGMPHLVVSGRGGGRVVGPFVAPGASPCLRCDDAHLGERDPRRALVVEQAARAAAPPPDPVTLTLALAWAVRDLVAWVDGDRPTTWGACFAIGPTGVPEPRSIARHPHCGCGWADFLRQATG
ncbi:hypothetical protein [Nocardioides sp. SYSU DS0663]|uniref:hypothetical protein n=1 Tax=Nocardioides sp. SYSU DS0663 TaxID=3416445 RepID=UPI003F4B82AC